MKLRKLMSIFTISFAVMTCFSLIVLAAEETTSENSNVNVEFVADTDTTDPVDPEQPGEGTGEPGTGAKGPLSIDYISGLNFGERAISGGLGVYTSTINQPYLQVTDKRGTGAGWKVTASASAFTSDEGDSLKGASIQLLGGRVNSENLDNPPVAVSPVEITTDNISTPIVSAARGTGLGTWVVRWYPAAIPTTGSEQVKLLVPAGAATLGAHTATITWTLSDTP